MRGKSRPSLEARAIALLAQREHSRAELRRKLLARLSADARADALAASAVGADGAMSESELPPDPAAVVDELLDWLEAHDYLSATRFAESRVNARAARFGSERIRHELAQHGVTLDPQALHALKDGELARARAIWVRKFKSPAPDAAGRAKQARFLAARGFSSDVIRRVVAGLSGDD